MKLNVSERLTLVRIVPEKGNFETMGTVEKLRDALYLSEEESAEFEVKATEDSINWNTKGVERVEIKISEMGMRLLTKTLEELDKKEELTTHQFQIFRRIKEEQQE
jgi:hypothetical protein